MSAAVAERIKEKNLLSASRNAYLRAGRGMRKTALRCSTRRPDGPQARPYFSVRIAFWTSSASRTIGLARGVGCGKECPLGKSRSIAGGRADGMAVQIITVWHGGRGASRSSFERFFWFYQSEI